MLIIPLIGKISLRNPPIVTILLILINVIVYFGLQGGDQAASMAAHRFYIESGLVEMELPRFLAFKETRPYTDADLEMLKGMDEAALGHLLGQSIRSGPFQIALDADQIITPEDPAYVKWKPLRSEFLIHFESAVSVRWGFRPIIHRPATGFTYMFLHGGVGHLIGNMIFLWLVGCILEYGAGRVSYLVIYILGGFAAVALYYAVEHNSAIPLVGASGSIAALMGALAVLFGKERIRIFFTVGFYFNTFRIMAIYLLPLWIGNEVFQLFFGGASQVAYTAHIGGLVGGAGIAFLHKRYWKEVDTEVLGDTSEDTVSPVLEQALSHMEKLEFAAARRLLITLQKEDPENHEVMRLLFSIDRHYPERPEIHSTTVAYLKHLSQDMDQRDTLLKAYDYYISAVKAPKLPPGLFLGLCRAFTAKDRPIDAERILAMLLKHKPDMPGLPAACLRLAATWQRMGKTDRMERCRQILVRRFPQSPEAAEIRQAGS
ncbi:MAG: rhomboid family intramembrane serine protease [Pseudomonadota bacterium]